MVPMMAADHLPLYSRKLTGGRNQIFQILSKQNPSIAYLHNIKRIILARRMNIPAIFNGYRHRFVNIYPPIREGNPSLSLKGAFLGNKIGLLSAGIWCRLHLRSIHRLLDLMRKFWSTWCTRDGEWSGCYHATTQKIVLMLGTMSVPDKPRIRRLDEMSIYTTVF